VAHRLLLSRRHWLWLRLWLLLRTQRQLLLVFTH
jgi:hypothetical protein